VACAAPKVFSPVLFHRIVSLAIAAGVCGILGFKSEKPLPADQEVHLIMDTYCTHKSAEVQRWLKPKRRNRFYFHFTPTSSFWLNRVERFFGTDSPDEHSLEHSTAGKSWRGP